MVPDARGSSTANRLRSFRKTLLQAGFARSVAVLISGSVLGQGITVLSAPWITRLYRPESFGILSIYASILSIACVFSTLRFEQAISLPEDDDIALNLLALSLVSVMLTSLFMAGGLALVGPPALSLFRVDAIAAHAWTLPVGVLGAGINQSLAGWATRRRDFKAISQTKIAQSIACVSIQVSSGLFGAGAAGLLFGDVSGRIGGIGLLTRRLLGAYPRAHTAVSLEAMRASAIRYVKFPLLSAPSGLFNALTSQIPSLLMASVFGPAPVGLLALGNRIVASPLTLLGQAIGQVYLSTAARQRDNHALLERLYYNVLGRLVLVGTPIMLGLIVAGPSLVDSIFGPTWLEAGIYLRAMSPLLFLQFLVSPITNVYDIYERQDVLMGVEFVRGLLYISSALATVEFSFTPLQAVEAFSLGGTMGYLLSLIATWHIVTKAPRERPS